MDRLKVIITSLYFIISTLCYGQSNQGASFKIEKKKVDTLKAIKKGQPSFSFGLDFFTGAQKASDFFTKHPSPSLLIQRISGADIVFPSKLTTINGMPLIYYFKSGIFENFLSNNSRTISFPIDFGFSYYSGPSFIDFCAGQRFFSSSNYSEFSNNILFEWGFGYGRVVSFRSNRFQNLLFTIAIKRIIDEYLVDIRLAVPLQNILSSGASFGE